MLYKIYTQPRNLLEENEKSISLSSACLFVAFIIIIIILLYIINILLCCTMMNDDVNNVKS